MSTYELFYELLKATGTKAADVARATGITTSTFTQWKQGKIQLKQDKLQKIADHFNVPLTYFYPESQPEEGHYIDPEVIALAHEMATRPELKVLLSASRDVSKEDLEAINQMVLRMAERNR